jgi:large subunit ribosomal protein L29
MTAQDLRVKEREAREEIFRLRLKLRTNQLDNHAGYRRARRELALIMTLLGEKTRREKATPSVMVSAKAAATEKRAG